jgi:hypothetical protein
MSRKRQFVEYETEEESIYNPEKITRYSIPCRLKDLIEIKGSSISYRSKCYYPSCKIIATYNYIGEQKAIFCEFYKLDGMIDIKSKPCQRSKCNIKPRFNYEGEKYPAYCEIHKLEDMIDIIDKICTFDGCTVDMCKNMKAKMKKHILPFYKCEMDEAQYETYQEMLKKWNATDTGSVETQDE